MSAGRNLNDNEYELLSAYLDGRLTDTERRELEARLQADADLRRELAAINRTIQLIHQLPTLKAPRSFALTPAMVLSGETRAPVPKPRSRLLIFPTTFAFSALSAAAAMLLFVLGTGLLLTNFGVSSMPPQNTASQLTNQTSIAALPSQTITMTETRARTASPTAETNGLMQQNAANDLGIASTATSSVIQETGRSATDTESLELESPESQAPAAMLAPPAVPAAPEEGLMDGFVGGENDDNGANTDEAETQNFTFAAPAEEQSQSSPEQSADAIMSMPSDGGAAGETAMLPPAPASTSGVPLAANALPSEAAADALMLPTKPEIAEPITADDAFAGADAEAPADGDTSAADGTLSMYADEEDAEEPPTGGMGGASSAFQPTFVPTLTASDTPRPTVTNTRRPSATPRPSNTPIPTTMPTDTPDATLTVIAQRGLGLTGTPAVSPMLQPNVRDAISDAAGYAEDEFGSRSDSDQRGLLFGAALVAISIILLGIAVATTLARRRQRAQQTPQ